MCRDPKQVSWIQSYYKIFKDLAEYVKDTFPNGIPWNPKGLPLEDALKAADAKTAGPPKAAGGPPPPPPPPPAPAPPRFDDVPKAAPAADGLGAVFADLNKGEAVTKGLRKVNAEQMTHKNPALRAGATVPTRNDSSSSISPISRGKSPAPGKKPKPESMRTKKPPIKKLDGNKWFIVSCYELVYNKLLILLRRTTIMKQTPSKSKRPFHTQFSSAVATRPPSF